MDTIKALWDFSLAKLALGKEVGWNELGKTDPRSIWCKH